MERRGIFQVFIIPGAEHRKYGLESRVRGFLDRKYGLDEKEEKNCNVREYFIFGDFLIYCGCRLRMALVSSYQYWNTWTPVFKGSSRGLQGVLQSAAHHMRRALSALPEGGFFNRPPRS